MAEVLSPPYRTVLKPYGRALVELARRRPEVVCLSGDLTRQCEIDLFQAEFGDRFIHCGMAEANMIGVAGALARQGLMPFVHSFGVFTTRRPLDQIVNAVAYPGLPVRLVGFMPGISSPGGPSHQAIEDMALMRALPNMTVIDVADATETAQAVTAMADLPGPVYLRLKRGEIPLLFPDDHDFSMAQAQILTTTDSLARERSSQGQRATGGGDQPPADGRFSTRLPETMTQDTERHGPLTGSTSGLPPSDVALFACGMMVAPALAAASTLATAAIRTTVINVPVIKPLDVPTVLNAATAARIAITAENHSIIGGLGSAVGEALAEAGLGRPLRRVGLQDTFAEGAQTSPYLFTKYGLTVEHLVTTIWRALDHPGTPPRPLPRQVGTDEYAPV